MLKKIRLYIYNHLGFSKSEANGLIFLVTFSILFFVLPSIYIHYFLPARELKNPTKEIKSWINNLEKRSKTEKKQLNNYEKVVNKKTSKNNIAYRDERASNLSFYFDPNHLPADSLKLLGFKPYIAERIEKYRKAGGTFNEKKDLLSIYGIDSSLVEDIWVYIRLPEKIEPKIIREKTIEIDLNKAKAGDLTNIPGVGPTFSERILKYGEMLGGYHSIKQLTEVYNLPDSTISLLSKSFSVSNDNLRKININTSPEDSLRKHPYISYKLSRIIVNYRNQHGNYQKIKDLKNIKLIDNELYEKLSPYLEVGK